MMVQWVVGRAEFTKQLVATIDGGQGTGHSAWDFSSTRFHGPHVVPIVALTLVSDMFRSVHNGTMRPSPHHHPPVSTHRCRPGQLRT